MIKHDSEYVTARAIVNAYFGLVSEEGCVPRLEEIMDKLPTQFRTDMYVELSITQRMEAYGITTNQELERYVLSGGVDHLIPNRVDVENFLRAAEFSYVKISRMESVNMAIQAVW